MTTSVATTANERRLLVCDGLAAVADACRPDGDGLAGLAAAVAAPSPEAVVRPVARAALRELRYDVTVPPIVRRWSCASCRAPMPYRHDPEARARGGSARPEYVLCERCGPRRRPA